MHAKTDDQLNWNQVFYFVEIAAAGSLRVAAEKLRLHSSTLSEHLAQLESDLNVKLFRRHRRGMELTEQGAKLYCQVKEMFATTKRFIDLMSPLSLGGYRICIALTPEASHFSIYSLIHEFATLHSDASIHVSCSQPDDLERSLLEAQLDFGITDRLISRSDIVQASVIHSAVGLFVSTKYDENLPLPVLLETLPLLTCEREDGINSAADRLLFDLGIKKRRRISSHLPNLIVELCRQGTGIALLPKVYFEGKAGARSIALPAGITALPENFYATWLAGREHSLVITRLRELLDRRSLKPPGKIPSL